jgi:predicted ribosome quality control (RQC) complex YloA/Tae2 family protein
MDLQKPTVLDAARISREIAGLKNSKILEVFRNQTRKILYLKLSNPELVLKYAVEGKIAYIAVTKFANSDAQKILPNLPGFELTDAEQMDFDRIISIHLQKKDRLGRKKSARIILEIIPNIGNMYLTDDKGTVKGMLRRKDITSYAPPAPLKKATVLNFDDSQLISIVEKGGNILGEIYGLSQRDIINISQGITGDPYHTMEALRNYVDRATRPGPAWVIKSGDEVVGYSLVEPELEADDTATRYESALSMYDAYYSEAVETDEKGRRLKSLQKILSTEIDRQKKILAAIKKELESAEDAARFKLSGDLILANIGNIESGAKKARLKNLESSSPEYFEIELDPSKSPVANAEKYFKKYKKSVSSRKALKRRFTETNRKLIALQAIETDFSGDVDNLESELQILIPAAKRASSKKQVPKRKPYRTFHASCGWEILIGKSNRDNDELTLRIASRNDYWFHAWQAAGSHTVLRLPAKDSIPDKQTLLEAASLAAYFSKARKSSKVPVIYTQVKYVRKPKKLPPGKVIVEREKQFMVRPANPEDFSTDLKK